MTTFLQATVNFADTHSELERLHAAKTMLQTVILAANGLRVVVVAPDHADDVRRCALVNGAKFLPEPQQGGLNAAVRFGVSELRNLGYDRVAVVHGKLPNVRDISWLASHDDGIVVVPDHTGTRTNAIAIPTAIEFEFAYGESSFQKHCNEARRHGVEPIIVLDTDVATNISNNEDLEQVDVGSRRLFATT